MSRVELPKDQWAELRDPEEVPEGKRRPLLKIVYGMMRDADAFGALQPGDAGAVNLADTEVLEAVAKLHVETLLGVRELDTALMIALISSWSYEWPVSEDSLLNELPGNAYDALSAAVGPMLHVLVPDLTDPGDVEDPKVVTATTGG